MIKKITRYIKKQNVFTEWFLGYKIVENKKGKKVKEKNFPRILSVLTGVGIGIVLLLFLYLMLYQ
jgi:hypothetical protein